jgi:hypothetical protein
VASRGASDPRRSVASVGAVAVAVVEKFEDSGVGIDELTADLGAVEGATVIASEAWTTEPTVEVKTEVLTVRVVVRDQVLGT